MKNFNIKLQDDDYYYKEVRKAAISASNINSILDGSFGEPTPWKIHFSIGSYFHELTLEPEKIDNYDVRDVPRRKAGETFLKQKEVDLCKSMKVSHDASVQARGVLYGPGVEYEVPGYTIIDGVLFVGKCDIMNPDIGYIGDLKSTGNMPGFDESIQKWYTSQLWIYWKIFNLPTVYIAVCKQSLDTRVIYPEKYQYADGKAKVLRAIVEYKKNYPEHYERNINLQKELGL